jgi:glycerol-3-phosphate dehydrogenase
MLVRAGGQAAGVQAENVSTGRGFELRATVVVDATGALGGPSGPFGAGAPGDLLPSRGSHILVPRDRIPGTDGMTIRRPGRVCIPA